MERKLLDMMNQLSISEYNPRMEYCDKFKFVNLPFERGEIFFSKGFLFYLHSQTIRKSQSLIYFKQNKVEVFILN